MTHSIIYYYSFEKTIYIESEITENIQYYYLII